MLPEEYPKMHKIKDKQEQNVHKQEQTVHRSEKTETIKKYTERRSDRNIKKKDSLRYNNVLYK